MDSNGSKRAAAFVLNTLGFHELEECMKSGLLLIPLWNDNCSLTIAVS